MSQTLNFQQVILRLHEFWAAQDCLIWEPHNVQVGAGTGNPATALRVLGPEPWRVAYVEPSVRPDDGRFGENPNRMQKYYQYQVILKPDPGNPQELYLASLETLGINPREHDIRFVEDNWESPALGAWGLGWEVWLDGQEITQFTYFQQAGGMTLDPVSIEITYGVERIALALQDKESAWEIDWMDGLSYGDVMLDAETEHCRYYFEVADVDALRQVYDAYEREYARALEGDALTSAYDYLLKCSHLFNVLDTRGAIGVTERAAFFRRMRGMTRAIAKEFIQKREQQGYPLLKMSTKWRSPDSQAAGETPPPPTASADVLIEIGVEEMPADDVQDVLAQAGEAAPALFASLRLQHDGLTVNASPRRIVLHAANVARKQLDEQFIAKGPPANRAYDAEGNPTRAALGFARGKGVDINDLTVRKMDGGEYVTALVRNEGRSTIEVLAENLPGFIAGLKFAKSMRWNQTNTVFSRPIRWIVALFGETVIPFEFAGVASDRVTRGLRPFGSPRLELTDALSFRQACQEQGIVLDCHQRQASIARQARELAASVGGAVPKDEALLTEVSNLVEAPTAFIGAFDRACLDLPRDVLVTVMRKHQRYFAVEDKRGQLMPYFIGVRNGDSQDLDKVIRGNQQVIRARFADAQYFYAADISRPLRDYLPRLDTLTFQAELGSMRAKNDRVAASVDELGELLAFEASDMDIARQAAQLAKADLATRMVVEITSLQGLMGREYALRQGADQAVADAIYEHWLPRFAGDELPASAAGRLLSLADKLDNLVGLFAAGLAPKSTSDPFGLRRTALGIIQILIDANISVDLKEAIDLMARHQPVSVHSDTKTSILNFTRARLENWLEESFAFPRDILNAVLDAQARNPAGALKAIRELNAWAQRDDWETILDSFARCVRITRGEPPQQLKPQLQSDPYEIELRRAYQSASASLCPADNIDRFLEEFEQIVPTVTAFFDNVLVHADDIEVRNNRIALLQLISQMQNGRANLSKLENF